MSAREASVERSEWAEPSEPAPRWRALLDRALLGRSGEHQQLPQRGPKHPPPEPEPHPPYPEADYPEPREQPYPAARERGGYHEFRSDHASTGHAPVDYSAGPAPAGYARPAPQPEPARERGYPPPPELPATPPGQRLSSSQQLSQAAPPVSQLPSARVGAPRRGASVADRAGGTAQLDPGRIEWRQAARPDDATGHAIEILRRELGGPKVLAFANPKGGVHKTTATALAAATIGSVRGRGVLAWDDNELRGTLGLRAGSARHARTIRHLIADLAEVESTSGMELADRVDDYLRHASDGTYDVLAGEENPGFAQRLDQQTVRRVLELLRRTHDVICVDTGNNVESPNWRTVLQAADQLVVTTVPREDAAFTADWMLDLLHDVGLGQLASGAVTLLSCASPTEQPLLADLRAHFATRTRAVAVVPYDPMLESGSSIEPAMLQPATRQAWLQAAATLLEPLTLGP